MSNRKGGHYDSDGDWWAPYSERSRWQKFTDAVFVFVVALVIVGTVGAGLWLAMSNQVQGDYRDGYDGPDRADQFHNR